MALNLQNSFNNTIANLNLNLLILKTKKRSMLTVKDNNNDNSDPESYFKEADVNNINYFPNSKYQKSYDFGFHLKPRRRKKKRDKEYFSEKSLKSTKIQN